MTATLDFSHLPGRPATARSRLDLAVDGIACGACIGDIETAMKRLPGVMLARLNLTNRRLARDWTDGALDPAQILQR